MCNAAVVATGRKKERAEFHSLACNFPFFFCGMCQTWESIDHGRSLQARDSCKFFVSERMGAAYVDCLQSVDEAPAVTCNVSPHCMSRPARVHEAMVAGYTEVYMPMT